jgi:ABC-type Zn uptake system ZnuABC Zn-binding protein ZnuA
LLSACQTSITTVTPTNGKEIKVIAVETFLSNIAQNVAGSRIKVETLAPIGVDPHEFEPTPQDMARIANSQVIIVNGAGVEGWLTKALENAGGQHLVIEASAGLDSRTPQKGELLDEAPGAGAVKDPHFWLDPISVAHYVENIRDGLIHADPDGEAVYTHGADDYIAQLNALDEWIGLQVNQIPAERRLLVTNHESFGYFADRYGFRIIGAIIPSVSSDASPSAQQLAHLIDAIRASKVKAIFLEAGVNPQLANQIAKETGVKVVSGLYTHSITQAGGDAPTYIDMMKFNTQAIVNALK